MEYFQVRPVSPNREGALSDTSEILSPNMDMMVCSEINKGYIILYVFKEFIPNHSRYSYSFVYAVHNVS